MERPETAEQVGKPVLVISPQAILAEIATNDLEVGNVSTPIVIVRPDDHSGTENHITGHFS